MGKTTNNLTIWLNNLVSAFIKCLAGLFYLFNIWEVQDRYKLIFARHNTIHPTSVPHLLIEILIVAEDRKYFRHIGIDMYAILRAIYKNFCGIKQGASTITQQYIRVLTKYYDCTLKRKLIEIFLALLINDKIDKIRIAENYLSIAFFGYGISGIDDALIKFNFSKINITTYQASYLIAHLKYPLKSYCCSHRNKLTQKRGKYILNVFENYKSLSSL